MSGQTWYQGSIPWLIVKNLLIVHLNNIIPILSIPYKKSLKFSTVHPITIVGGLRSLLPLEFVDWRHGLGPGVDAKVSIPGPT